MLRARPSRVEHGVRGRSWTVHLARAMQTPGHPVAVSCADYPIATIAIASSRSITLLQARRTGNRRAVTHSGVEEPRSAGSRRPTQTCLRCRTGISSETPRAPLSTDGRADGAAPGGPPPPADAYLCSDGRIIEPRQADRVIASARNQWPATVSATIRWNSPRGEVRSNGFGSSTDEFGEAARPYR